MTVPDIIHPSSIHPKKKKKKEKRHAIVTPVISDIEQDQPITSFLPSDNDQALPPSPPELLQESIPKPKLTKKKKNTYVLEIIHDDESYISDFEQPQLSANHDGLAKESASFQEIISTDEDLSDTAVPKPAKQKKPRSSVRIEKIKYKVNEDTMYQRPDADKLNALAVPDVKKTNRFIRPEEREAIHASRQKITSKVPLQGTDFTTGRFTDLEKLQVERAVQEYLKENHIPQEDVKYLLRPFVNGGDNPYLEHTKDFVDVVIFKSGLNRARRQVYWYLTRLFNENRADGRRWTAEEDVWLVEMTMIEGTKWAKFEQEIGRTSTRERYRRLISNSEKFNSGPWLPEEEYRLIKAVKMNLDNPETFDVTQGPNNWDAIASKVISRSAIQCITRWYGVTRYIVDGQYRMKKWSKRDHAHLLKRMLHFNAADESGVDFSKISLATMHSSWGKGQNATCIRMEWYRMRKRIPNVEKMTFNQAIQYVLDNYDDMYPEQAKQHEERKLLAKDHRKNEKKKQTLVMEDVSDLEELSPKEIMEIEASMVKKKGNKRSRFATSGEIMVANAVNGIEMSTQPVKKHKSEKNAIDILNPPPLFTMNNYKSKEFVDTDDETDGENDLVKFGEDHLGVSGDHASESEDSSDMGELIF